MAIAGTEWVSRHDRSMEETQLLLERLIHETGSNPIDLSNHGHIDETKPVAVDLDEHVRHCLNMASRMTADCDDWDQDEFLRCHRMRRDKARAALKVLTFRERQVAVLVGHGYSNKQVASFLGVSEKTVEKYRGAACRKLRLPTSAQVAHLLSAADLCAGVKAF